MTTLDKFLVPKRLSLSGAEAGPTGLQSPEERRTLRARCLMFLWKGPLSPNCNHLPFHPPFLKPENVTVNGEHSRKWLFLVN